jgi:hypothetical protein
MHSNHRYIQFVVFCVLILVASTSGFAQRQNAKGPPTAATQSKVIVTQLSLEEPGGVAMVFGSDGMLYVLSSYGGRYRKGILLRLNPEAFSHPKREKDQPDRPPPDDLAEVYVFGRPGEISVGTHKAEFHNGPREIIAAPDGKLYVSGNEWFCARFDPITQKAEWLKLGLTDEDFPSKDPTYSRYSDPTYRQFANISASCFTVTADGLLWCKAGDDRGITGKVFHTRGEGKDLEAIAGTDEWRYATLADDGYIYGATDEALVRVKTDGSDIAILHAFIGKDDHPVGAPVLVHGTLYGCARDAGRDRSGYIYKLNPDGSEYSTIVNLDYEPKQPLVAKGDFAYGIGFSPVRQTERRRNTAVDKNRKESTSELRGLFRISGDTGKVSMIVPAKDPPIPQALIVDKNTAYVLTESNPALLVRVSLPATPPATAAASAPGQTSRGSAPARAAGLVGDGTSNPAPADAAPPVPGGKSVFHKRQTTYDSQGAPPSAEGTSSTALDEGISGKPRPGLPPRQSKPGAKTTEPSPSADSENSFLSTEQPSTDAGSASPAGANQKSVFHKRQSAEGEGAAPNAEGTSSAGGDEGISTKPRPGLPPRQSRTPGKAAAAPPSSDSENSFSSTEQSATGWGSSSSSAQQPSSRTSRRSTEGNEGDVSDSSAGANDVSAFVERQMQAMSAQDMETLVSLYGDNADYLDKGVVSNDAIRNDLQQYFDRFPVTQWQVAGAVSSKQLAGGNYQISFPVTFDVSNPSTGKHITGVALQTEVIATDSAGNMKIISRHEKVTSSRGSSDKPKKQRPERERVYQGRPVIPIPPNIPWPPGLPRP